MGTSGPRYDGPSDSLVPCCSCCCCPTSISADNAPLMICDLAFWKMNCMRGSFLFAAARRSCSSVMVLMMASRSRDRFSSVRETSMRWATSWISCGEGSEGGAISLVLAGEAGSPVVVKGVLSRSDILRDVWVVSRC